MRSLHFLILPILAFAMLSLSGCNEAQIARAEAVADHADEVLAQAKAAVRAAGDALVIARQVADQVNDARAVEAVAMAQKAYDQVQASVPVIEAATVAAHSAVEAAKKSQENGDTTLQTLIAIGISLLTGGGVTGLVKNRTITVAKRATALLADHVDAMRSAETDEDAARVDQVHAPQRPAVVSFIAQARAT